MYNSCEWSAIAVSLNIYYTQIHRHDFLVAAVSFAVLCYYKYMYRVFDTIQQTTEDANNKKLK